MKPSIRQVQERLRALACEVEASGLRGYARRIRGLATNLNRAEPKTRNRKRKPTDEKRGGGFVTPGGGANW